MNAIRNLKGFPVQTRNPNKRGRGLNGIPGDVSGEREKHQEKRDKMTPFSKTRNKTGKTNDLLE